MTKQVQRRRGTDSQHTSFTGADGELSVNTTNKSVHVHDGVTAGGVEAARADLDNVLPADIASGLSGGTVASLTITSADINGGNIDGTSIGGSTPASGTFSSISTGGNITVGGTVDGRDVAADGTKLDGIEAGATADQTGSEIATAVSGQTVGSLTITSADINGGTIDGATIGGTTAGAGTFTAFTSNGIDDNATSTAVTLDSSGNVGIGTSSPTNFGSGFTTLEVQDSTAGILKLGFDAQTNVGSRIQAQNDQGLKLINTEPSAFISFGTVSSERMRIDSSGNVGIGTSIPLGRMHSKTSSSGVTAVNSGADDLLLESNGNTGLTVMSSNTALALIYFADPESTQAGAIQYSHADDSMRFRANNSEALRLDSAGNVGIGTSSPATALDVSGEIRATNRYLANTGGGATKGYQFTGDGNTGMYSDTSDTLQFSTAGSERVRIDSSGNVGIGLSFPSAKLDVVDSSTGLSATRDLTGRFFRNDGTYNPRLEIRHSTAGTHLNHRYTTVASDLIFEIADTERARLDGSGNVSIGSTSNDGAKFLVSGDTDSVTTPVCYIKDIDGSVEGGSTLLRLAFTSDTSFSTAYYAHFSDSTATQGYISSTGSGSVSYFSGSDERLKQNIVDTASKWEVVKAIQVRDFEWKSNGAAETGFIAQELNNHCPDAVNVGTDNVEEQPWGVDYGKLTPFLTKALQEAIAKIETLETKVAALENA